MDSHILIVDDDPDLAHIIEALLRVTADGRRYVPVIASTASSALEVFKTRHWDALLVDYHLPDMDGIEFIREVRKINKRVGIVMLTGDPVRAGRQCGGLGVWCVIPKPFDLSRMSRIIAKIEDAIEITKMPPADFDRITQDLAISADSLHSVVQQVEDKANREATRNLGGAI